MNNLNKTLMLLGFILSLIFLFWYTTSLNRIEAVRIHQRHLTDSLVQIKIELKKQKAIKDTVIVYQDKIIREKVRIVDSTRYEYEKDKNLANCDNLVNELSDLSHTQFMQIDTLKSALFLCDNINYINDSIFLLKDKELIYCYQNEAKLKQQLDRKWFLSVNIGTGLNTDLVGSNWRIGHSVTVGLSRVFSF